MPPAPLPSPAARSVAPPRPAAERAVPPLLPVLLPLVVAAITLSVLFAWLFPGLNPARPVPAARFTDATAAAGIHFVRRAALGDPPTTLGGAVAVLDYDHDGHPDLFFVNGTAWPWEDPAGRPASPCALYHNDGHGHFTDVTLRAGLDRPLQGMAVAVGDYDNDGFPDLFVTCVGANHLFHNRGDGTFEDVTLAAGVGGDDNTWSTGAAWIDLAGTGRLDLVVGHYARWPQEVTLASAFVIADVGHSYGAPTGFVSAFPSVYRNRGHGRFTLVPGGAGLRNVDPQTGLPVGEALAILPVDANGDGRLDLLFTYQNAPNALFVNQGDGTFRQRAGRSGYRAEGASASLASVSLLPYAQAPDVDERLAALQTAVPAGPPPGPAPPSPLSDKLGRALLDYERDGHLAIFSGNARMEPDTNKFEDGRDFRATPQLFVSRPGRWAAAPAAGHWAEPIVARGIATADFDGDGRDDIVIAQNNGPALLLRNDQRGGMPWLRLVLVATRTQPEAGGARVEVHTPRRILTATVAPAMGYMAQSETALTFGLGEDARVRKIVIRWPSGRRQTIHPAGINRTLVIREP